MTTLLTNQIASMTDMREPHKVLERSDGKAVAILKNSHLVGYFVPAEAVGDHQQTEASTRAVLESLRKRQPTTEPIRAYLKDK